MHGDDLDPYRVLGVRRGASLLEIARARRRLAKEYHPDVARGDPATGRMQAVNAAWELLSDPDRRRAWDNAASRAAAGATAARNVNAGQTWTEWAYGTVPTSGRVPAHPRSTSHSGWFVLVAALLLLALILGAGIIAAIDGPSNPGRDSPVLQHNLDAPGQP